MNAFYNKKLRYFVYLCSLILGQSYIFLLLILFSKDKISINSITYLYSFIVLGTGFCSFGLNYNFIHLSVFFNNNLLIKKLYLSFIYLIIITSLIFGICIISFTDVTSLYSISKLIFLFVFSITSITIYNLYSIVLISKDLIKRLLLINLIRIIITVLLFFVLRSLNYNGLNSFYIILIFSNFYILSYFFITEKLYKILNINLKRSFLFLYSIIKKNILNYINSLFLPFIISYINIYLYNDLNNKNLNATYNVARYFSVFISFLPNSFLQKKMPEFIIKSNQEKYFLLNIICNKILIQSLFFWILFVSTKFLIFNYFNLNVEGFFIYDMIISITTLTIITSIPGFYLNSKLDFKKTFLNNLIFTLILLLLFKYKLFNLKPLFFIYLILTFIFNIYLYIIDFKIYGQKVIFKTVIVSLFLILYFKLYYNF